MGLNVSQVICPSDRGLKARTGAGHPGEDDIGGLVLVSISERKRTDPRLIMVSLHEQPKSSRYRSSLRVVLLMLGAWRHHSLSVRW